MTESAAVTTPNRSKKWRTCTQCGRDYLGQGIKFCSVRCRRPEQVTNLGRQPVHHVCANRRCVNPHHLVPVTQAENNAEMLARRAYEARIAELESALRALDASHPALRGA